MPRTPVTPAIQLTGSFVVVGPDGTEITIQPTVAAVRYPPAPMLVGITMTPAEYAARGATDWSDNLYGRVYTPQGSGLYTWDSVVMKQALRCVGYCVHGSMKDSPTPALLNPVFDAIPPGYVYRLTVHHEPEQGPAQGDPDHATYLRDWKLARAVADDHPKRDQIVLTEVLTDYAETHGKGPWDSWWTGQADELGWDVYMGDVTTKAFPSAEALFALPVAVARTLGTRFVVSEFAGNPLVVAPTDRTGVAYADALERHVDYLDGTGLCAAVSYFDENGSSGDHRLSNVPVAESRWKALVGR